MSTSGASKPLSIEEVLAKRKEQEAETSRPKFLSKKEREALALKRREEAVLKQKKIAEQIKTTEAEYVKGRSVDRTATERERNRGRRDDRRNNRERVRDGEREKHGDSYKDKRRRNVSERENGKDSFVQDIFDEREREAIRARYLGIEQHKKQTRRMNEKKVDFNWSANDDTSNDYNPIYKNRHEATFYGRGHLGGYDLKEQKKINARFYEDFSRGRESREYTEAKRSRHANERKRDKIEDLSSRHWSEKPLSEMNQRDWRIFKEDYNIASRGGNIPNPLRSWKESLIPHNILRTIDKLGYKEPTPIQRQAIPIGLQNRDIIGVAETGSGKTAAFVIPMLVWISMQERNTAEDVELGPFAIIMAPTRELANQIEEETVKFARPLGIRTVAIIGGLSKEEQGFKIRQGCDIVIATPGRLKDVLDSHYLVLNRCTYVVLDEADRMIEMNFENDVKDILDYMPVSNMKPEDEDVGEVQDLTTLSNGKKYRQTVMFTATMPPAVERIAKTYLRRPATVHIGTVGRATQNVEQIVYMTADENAKRKKLWDALEYVSHFPVIIFVNQKKATEVLARLLEGEGFRATTLHGSKTQEMREASLSKIKSGERDILVATDVAGRGIDIKDVSLVINYDMAKSIEDYTHRIGRTGRAGNLGKAVTFLTEDDSEVFYALKKIIEESPCSKCPKELRMHPAAQVSKKLR
eukprot:Nk52_evm8s1401 gene=Nk52_evmTU8s1401